MRSRLIRLAQLMQFESSTAADLINKLAEESDAEYLKKINLRELIKSTETEKPDREYYQQLQEQANTGPIFSETTLDFIRDLSANSLPRNNRKIFVKWLANQFRDGFGVPIEEEVQYIRDWIEGAGAEFENLSFREAHTAAEAWHANLWVAEDENLEDPYKYEKKDGEVVYRFENGFFILKLTAGECSLEGKQMGHCVGGYADRVNEGDIEIYSLRAPNNKPHVTIEVDVEDQKVSQIKGKENKPPIEKYAVMIKEWLKTTKFNYQSSTDYFLMSPIEEAIEIWRTDPKRFNYFLAKHPEVPVDILDHLSRANSYATQNAVINHPNVSEETLLSILSDLKNAKVNLTSMKIMIRSIFKRIAEHSNSESILKRIAEELRWDSNLTVGETVEVALLLAGNEHLPSDAVLDLFVNLPFVRYKITQRIGELPPELYKFAVRYFGEQKLKSGNLSPMESWTVSSLRERPEIPDKISAELGKLL